MNAWHEIEVHRDPEVLQQRLAWFRAASPPSPIARKQDLHPVASSACQAPMSSGAEVFAPTLSSDCGVGCVCYGAMTEETPAQLIAKAETCRSLAANTQDPVLAATVLRLAAEYEAKAAKRMRGKPDTEEKGPSRGA